MIYTTSKIMQDVRICMDENRSAQTLIETGDTESVTLNEIILSKICEGVERVHMQAPFHLLENGHNMDINVADPNDDDNDASIFWDNRESGHVILPDNFMRLVVFEMSDWERPVYKAITAADPQYKLQHCRIKALRGNPQRPVCALVQRPEGKSLEFYSCKSTSATVTKAMYIPYPIIDEHDGVDISERCYTAVVNTIAALTMLTIGDKDAANIMLEMAKSYLER